MLLLDHISSTRPPVYAGQWLLEQITILAAGEHFSRRQLLLVQAAEAAKGSAASAGGS